MKKLALALLLTFAAVASAQTGNTLHASQFLKAQGTVGDAVAAAQAQCLPDARIPCYIVIDPPLAVFPPGNMPAPCQQCIIQDFRLPARPSTSFNDTGSMSSYAASYLPVSGGSTLTGVWVHADTPWLGCTGPVAMVIQDDQGNTLASFNSSTISGTGAQTPYDYIASFGEPTAAVIASNATLLHASFTSPAGCTSYATGIVVTISTFSPWYPEI